jgi:hypothetical protein
MDRFVVGASQDVLALTDPVSFWAVRIMLLLAAVLGGWLAFDTRGALKTMVEFSSRLSHLAKRLSINPERAGWVWFYRIDGAVVLAGVIWIFSRHYFGR